MTIEKATGAPVKRETKKSTKKARTKDELLDQSETDPKEDEIDSGVLQEEDDEIQVDDPSSRGRVFRHSDLRRLIEEHARENGLDPNEIKPARFIRDHGLPNPTRLYRVAATKGKKRSKVVSIEAVDESDAIRQFFRLAKAKEPHRWRPQVFVSEE